jgi:hypothetical protein
MMNTNTFFRFTCFPPLLFLFLVVVPGAYGFTVVVDDGTDTGLDTSLLLVNGYPAISYFDNENGMLRYVRSSEAYGRVWGKPVTVDANSGAGQYTSMAIVDGHPAISYFYESGTAGMLMYVRADDPSGTAWGTPVVVDASTPGIGLFPSMVVIDGRPAVSYFDDENGQLRYVRAANSSGTAWGAPAVVDATA